MGGTREPSTEGNWDGAFESFESRWDGREEG